MRESDCKAALCKILRASLPVGVGRVFRHEDAWTGGIPDISISYKGRTLWVEVKLTKNGRKSKATELQLKALRELGGVLLVFREHKDGQLEASIHNALGDFVWAASYPTRAQVYRDTARRLLLEVGL